MGFFKRNYNKNIFIHIPKTAGTSFRHIVKQEYKGKNCVYIYSHEPEFFKSIKKNLMGAQSIYGHFSYGIHNTLGINGQYITFLRNPIERVISLYYYNSVTEDAIYYNDINNGMSLFEMVTCGKYHETNNHMVRIISGYRDVKQLDENAVLDKALDNIKKYFLFVGMVEKFPESIQILSRKLKWRSTYNIPSFNVNYNKPSLKIDTNTLKAIKDSNRLDKLLYEHIKASFTK